MLYLQCSEYKDIDKKVPRRKAREPITARNKDPTSTDRDEWARRANVKTTAKNGKGKGAGYLNKRGTPAMTRKSRRNRKQVLISKLSRAMTRANSPSCHVILEHNTAYIAGPLRHTQVGQGKYGKPVEYHINKDRDMILGFKKGTVKRVAFPSVQITYKSAPINTSAIPNSRVSRTDTTDRLYRAKFARQTLVSRIGA